MMVNAFSSVCLLRAPEKSVFGQNPQTLPEPISCLDTLRGLDELLGVLKIKTAICLLLHARARGINSLMTRAFRV